MPFDTGAVAFPWLFVRYWDLAATEKTKFNEGSRY
jgi:hypothetical protein